MSAAKSGFWGVVRLHNIHIMSAWTLGKTDGAELQARGGKTMLLALLLLAGLAMWATGHLILQ